MVSFLLANVALLGAAASAASVAPRQASLPCGATQVEDYQVPTGYNLTIIAKQRGSGICDIASVNGIENPDVIRAGAIIKVPKCVPERVDNESCTKGGPSGAPAKPVPCGSPEVVTVQIKPGDTLGKYASEYDSSICDIADYNGLEDPNLIFAGNTIGIPSHCKSKKNDSVCLKKVGRRQTTDAIPCVQTVVDYKVGTNDTLAIIATKFNSGICDIAKLSNIKNPDVVQLGQGIKVPRDCTTPDNTSCLPPSNKATATCVNGVGSSYNVREGETLTTIAADFNVTLDSVKAANSDINPDVIAPAQLINIPICPNSCCDWVGTYKIKSGDTFFQLASDQQTTVGQIKAVNARLDPTKLAIGQQIILPKNCRN